MNEKKKIHKGVWIKGLLWLFFVVLFFTVVSRIAAAFTVAQVKTGHFSSRKIRHTVTVEGQVEKNRELSVFSEPDIGVKAVFVSVKQRVKKGEVLAQLDMGDLENKIVDAAGEKRVLELQNRSLEKQKGMKYQIEANKLSIRRLEEKMQEYEKIRQKKGRIRAAFSGVVTELLVNAGQKTQDGGILTMTDDRAGFVFSGKMKQEGMKYISRGDKITLSLSGREIKNLAVTSLALDEGGELIQVSVLLPAKSASLGEPASIKLVKESENYSCTVPAAAVFRENGKTFVLLAETRDTVLGEQQIAIKKEVKVLEENEDFAALEESVLDKDSVIIIESDRYVEAGDSVRLMEE